MKIALDAFGGDNAPYEIVAGGIKALEREGDIELLLTGDEGKIREILKNFVYDEKRVEIINCTEVITNDEAPTVAIRNKKDSSLVVALDALKKREDVSGLVSAGSTGAVLAGGLLRVGRIKGISRPALSPSLPTIKGGNVILTDCGANVDCKPVNLVHFAIMGSLYAKAVYQTENPKVALLSNGTEDKKGNELCHETFPLLKECKYINFIGNMEARDILSGEADVVVTDGFAGNVALKGMEGAIGSVLSLLKGGIKSSFKAKIGYLFMKKVFKGLKGTLDYNSKGGAPFLGIEKAIIKSHGSSKAESIACSVLQAAKMARSGLCEKIKEQVSEMQLGIQSQGD